MLVDSHAHLEAVEDLEGALVRAKDAGVEKIVTIGTSLASSKKTIEIADSPSSVRLRSGLRGAKENFPEIYATVGLHPKDTREELKRLHYNDILKQLRSLVSASDKVVAIGECGLDYYERETGNNKQSLRFSQTAGLKQETSEKNKKYQRELFGAQIRLAAELKLPLVIHCRNGWSEIFELITNVKNYSSSETGGRIEKFSTRFARKARRASSNNKLRGVFHSWTGNWDDAKRALDLGFYISFSGIVTFSNAADIQEVARKMPFDRILIETDSPYLAPEPFRGSTNEPKNVKIVAQFIAGIRNQTVDEVSSKTSANARKLFNLL